MARFDLTDAEWALIEPHVPVAATGPLPRRVRDQFNGILWRFRTGSGWRDVPERYGPWSTVYSRFNAWVKAGVFQVLMDALIAEAASRGQVGLELVSVDSTIVRAHHESAGLAVAGETLDALEQALRKPTAAVFITHMPTNGGLLQPAEEIGDLIRQHQPDAWYVLDACQSAGQAPLDVEKIQCDVLSATSRKYLRGPRGAGFVYVRKARIESMEPPLLDLHAAELTSATEYVIRPDARRFENWESYIAGRLGMGAAVDYALALGMDNIWARVQQQGERLRSKLTEIDGVRIHDTGDVRGGIVTFSREGVPSESLLAALSAEKINTSLSNIYRTHLDAQLESLGTYIRASAHYITTDDEIKKLVDVVAETKS